MAREPRDGGLVGFSGTSPLSDVTSGSKRHMPRLPMRINLTGACGQVGSTLEDQQHAPGDTLFEIDEFATALHKQPRHSHSNLTLETGTAAELRIGAWMGQRLEPEHRELLLQLPFDDRGTPSYRGMPAGVRPVLGLTPI
jgi:hypothetical protein